MWPWGGCLGVRVGRPTMLRTIEQKPLLLFMKCSMVKMAPCFETFDVEEQRDLETRVRGRQGHRKLSPSSNFGIVSYSAVSRVMWSNLEHAPTARHLCLIVDCIQTASYHSITKVYTVILYFTCCVFPSLDFPQCDFL